MTANLPPVGGLRTADHSTDQAVCRRRSALPVRPLLSRRLQTDHIIGCWDDLLRVAASVHGGHATAAMVVGKLRSAKKQQNALTSAIKEYGTLRRTIYAARYLADETYQRRALSNSSAAHE